MAPTRAPLRFKSGATAPQMRSIRADERTRHIKVIALTSSEDSNDKQVCNELGVIAFFSKPLKRDALLNSHLLDRA